MTKWSIEVFEFYISFESRKTLKAQTLANSIAEMTSPIQEIIKEWMVFVDGSSKLRESGAIPLLENK